MALYPEPHSPEWFSALDAVQPAQAAHTRQILNLAGRNDVCGVCGDDPAEDLKLVQENLPNNAVASLRLCADCRQLRQVMHSESYAPLGR